MHSDDTPRGQLLTRREMLALLGTSGAALALGAGLARPRPGAASVPPACVVRPEQTEGPYFVDELLNRSDIRSDPEGGIARPGTPLLLSFLISSVALGRCEPLAGAQVHLWHCDALGVYSDVSDPTFNTVGQKFLRGHQITDKGGQATFHTIYPGWYPGRAVHIHFKIRMSPKGTRAAEFTSQLYFDDALTDRIHGQEPYLTKGAGRTRNAGDRIFRQGGDQLLLEPRPTAEGLEATFALAMTVG